MISGSIMVHAFYFWVCVSVRVDWNKLKWTEVVLLVVYLFLSFIPFPIHDTVISSRHITFHYHSSMYWLYSSMTFMSSFHTSFSSMFSQLTRHSCISHVRCIEVTNGDKSLRIKSRSQVLNTKWLKTKLHLIFQDLRSS